MSLEKKLADIQDYLRRKAVIDTWRKRLNELREKGMHTKKLCIKYKLNATYICHMMSGRYPSSGSVFDKIEAAIHAEEVEHGFVEEK